MYIEISEFSGENMPVAVVVRVMRKDKQYIRQWLIQDLLKLGVVVKKDGSNEYDCYISPLKFWIETGYIYRRTQV